MGFPASRVVDLFSGSGGMSCGFYAHPSLPARCDSVVAPLRGVIGYQGLTNGRWRHTE